MNEKSKGILNLSQSLKNTIHSHTLIKQTKNVTFLQKSPPLSPKSPTSSILTTSLSSPLLSNTAKSAKFFENHSHMRVNSPQILACRKLTKPEISVQPDLNFAGKIDTEDEVKNLEKWEQKCRFNALSIFILFIMGKTYRFLCI